MANEYYNPSGTPGFQTRALSSQQRNEDASVSAGFDKLPSPSSLAGSAQNYAADTGTVNALVVTLNPQIVAPYDGMELVIKAKNAPSGPTTVLAGAQMIANVTRADGSTIKPNDWASGQIITLRYNATTSTYQFQPSYNGTVVPPAQLNDAAPQFVNASDATKLARVDLSQLSTGVTRTVTLQDRDMVLGRTFLDRSPRTSNTTLVKANQADLIDFTAGGFTQLFAASTTLGRGWWAYLQNSGTGDVELQAPAAVSTTSTTSNSIAAGTTWTLPTGLSIGTGDTIVLRRTADPFNQRVTGFVTSYTSGTGVAVVNVIARVGSGTFTDWSVSVCPVASAIDGLPSYVMYPGELRLFYVPETGVGIRSNVLRTFYRKATTSYTFICPPGYRIVNWDGVGGAGGAGSGAKGAASIIRTGGSPGGSPARIRRKLSVSAANGLIPGYSYAQSIGAAGTSGGQQTQAGTNGISGTNGGNTSIGTLVIAYGGVGGVGGFSGGSTLGYGTTGSGLFGLGVSSILSGNISIPGGAPYFAYSEAGNNVIVAFEEGGASARNTAANNSIWGGASSVVSPTSTVAAALSGSSVNGVAAGGWGGGITDANAICPAGAAGLTSAWAIGGGAAAGTSGASPTAGANGPANGGTDFDMGNPGGGGGGTASANTSGGRGGNGTGPGAPGGGGGACLDGTGASGAGGTSQQGQSITWGEL